MEGWIQPLAHALGLGLLSLINEQDLLQLLPASTQQQGPSDRHGRELQWWKVAKPSFFREVLGSEGTWVRPPGDMLLPQCLFHAIFCLWGAYEAPAAH